MGGTRACSWGQPGANPSPPLATPPPPALQLPLANDGAAAHRPPSSAAPAPRPARHAGAAIQPCSHPAAWRGEPPGGWSGGQEARRASLRVALVSSVEPSACWRLQGNPLTLVRTPSTGTPPSPFSIEIDQKLQEIMKQTGYLTIEGQVT